MAPQESAYLCFGLDLKLKLRLANGWRSRAIPTRDRWASIALVSAAITLTPRICRNCQQGPMPHTHGDYTLQMNGSDELLQLNCCL